MATTSSGVATPVTEPPGRKQLTPRQRERRQRILAATRQLVGRHGYDGMIMRDVAARAKVSATTLYNLYNTKDELLVEALAEQQQLAARRAYQEAGGPGLELMLRHLRHVARQSRESPAYVEAIVRALLNAGPQDTLVAMLMERLRRMLEVSLEAMAARRELKTGTNVGQLAVALTGAFWSSFLLWNKGLVTLESLEPALTRNYLSLLIPVTRGKLKTELGDRLQGLG